MKKFYLVPHNLATKSIDNESGKPPSLQESKTLLLRPPELPEAIATKNEIENTLNDQNIPPDLAMKRYNQLFQKLQQLTDKLLQQSTTISTTSVKNHESDRDRIISALEPNQRRKASKLLDIILKHPQILR